MSSKKSPGSGAFVTVITDSASSISRSTGVKTIKVYGPVERTLPRDYRRIRVLPNPWPPHDIEQLVKITVLTAGLAPVAYKLIALWIEDRKARRIKIKHGEHEIEIQGGVSAKEIERAFSAFRKLIKESDNDCLKITVPPKVDRSIPIEMAREASQLKNKKKGDKK